MILNHRKLFKIDNRTVTEDEAVESGIYSIYLLSDDDLIDRIEMVNKGDIFKVAYPDRERPFDDALENHFKTYPKVDLEIWEKKELEENNIFRYRAYLYDSEGTEILVKDCFLDSEGLLVKEKELDDDLEISCEFEYLYENGKLSKIFEFDSDGKKVSEQDLK
jgi:hypothetical protein